jgi:hypothetical protein
MPRNRTLALVTLFLALTGGLYAEYQIAGKDVFPVTRPIVKVYAHRLGYKIIFQRENTDFGVFYVPMAWFGQAGGKGEIVWGVNPAYPAFTAFYVDGAFSHIRLYLITNPSDATWSVLAATEAEEQQFQVDTLTIAY